MSTQTISYKLAKELKKAGFPQKKYKDGRIDCPCQHRRKGNIMTQSEMDGSCGTFAEVYIPTLEEIIDACKQKGRCIELTENQKCYTKILNRKGKLVNKLLYDYQWTAELVDWNNKKYGKKPCYESGDEVVATADSKTSLEAMVRLYIKLHVKK